VLFHEIGGKPMIEHPGERQPMDDPNPHLRHDTLEDVRLAREVADLQRLAGREFVGQTRNFLRPEQRVSRTEGPMERMAARRALLASRTDPNAARLAAADQAREIGNETTLSGRTSESRRRFDPGEMEPHFVRRADGSLSINWERVAEGLPE
jgi:hypothetical protein